MIRGVHLAIAIAATTTGCTLFLSGSGYTGGEEDAGATDASTLDSGASDGGIECDVDEDGFRVAECVDPPERADCDDTDPLVHPGAPPVCGNDTDDACNAGGPALVFDEIGFFGTQTVPAPAGGAPDRLRMFARSAEEGLLLFQLRNAAGTPFVARPRLERSDGTSAAPVRLAEALGGELPTARARFDAQRDNAGDVRVAMLFGDGGTTLDLIDATFPGNAADPPARGAMTTVSPLVPLSDPALVLLGDALHLFLAADTGTGAVAGRIALADGAVAAVSGAGVVDPSRTWGVSGRTVGILPGVADAIVAWSGPPPASTADARAIPPSAPSFGRPAVIETAPRGSMRRIVIAVPTDAGIHVAVHECPFAMPLTACTVPTPGLARTYPGVPSRGAPLAVLPTSPTGIAIVYVEERTGDDALAIGLVDTAGAELPPTMPSIPVPTRGIGPIRDLSIDFRAVAVPAVTGAIEVTATFSYIRQIPAMSSSIYVGGARVCVDVGGT